MVSRSFTDLFIRRPVIALVVNIIILVVGLVSVVRLNTRQYPRSDSAVVKISTVYFGASADTVRGYITTQIERVVASADGIDYIESESRAGFSTISVYLRLNYDTNAALAQISSKIDQVRGELPPESEAPTISVETSDNQFASMYLSFYSDTLDQNQITDYLNRMVQPRLSAVKGVQRADVLGGRVFAMRAWLKPDRLAAHGLSPADVRQALATNNALAAVGATKGSMLRVSLVANTDLRNVDEFRQLVVAQRNGVIVRLADVADVVLGAESYDEEVRFGGQTATFMGIWVLPSESTVEVIKRVREALPDIERALPAGLKARIGYDASKYIDDALKEIVKTLTETLLIVAVVIFLFMGSFRSVLVPIKAIVMNSLSVIATFGLTVLVFQEGVGGSLLDFTEPAGAIFVVIPVLVFAVVFGLSMDYEVFLLSRIKEAYDRTGRNTEATAEGLGATATVITSAALIMITVFGAFIFARVLVMQFLGFGLAVAVLLDATIIRMVLVPAFMRLAGRWNWWPGRSSVDD